MIYIITLTNKPNLLPEAIQTVRCQTQPAVHVIGYDAGAWDWRGLYPPAVWFNERAQALGPDDYVAWLSDDDLLECHFVEVMSQVLDEGYDAVYCPGWHVVEQDGSRRLHRLLPIGNGVFDARNLPSGRMDGGQVMVRRSALDRIDYPYAPEGIDGARVSDGAYLDKLARMIGIYPATDTPLVTLRTTEWSAHTRARPDLSLVRHDWGMA